VRNIPYWNNWVNLGKWKRGNDMFSKVYTIKNKNVGIIGFGSIGKQIFKKIFPFGPIVYICDPFLKVRKELKINFVKLSDLLKKSDYIILACASTKENFHMLDETQFKIMKKGVSIINVARGPLINEAVLIKYLKKDKIAGVALDVLEREPIEENNPLLKMENVIITPHQAGYSPESFINLKKMVFDEIIRILRGEKLKNCVDI